MSIENHINRCTDAVSIINGYLLANQKSDSYNRWLERYSKHPSEHDDGFLFGKLAQAIFSGGLNGKVVDNWMPRMEEVFHGWNVEWISKLSAKDIELIAKSGQVLANRPKLKAVISNARIVIGLKSKYGSFGQYLASFKSPVLRSTELANRFAYLGEVTTEDFLRNIGFDTAKPDRHLTRWLERMQAIDSATPGKVLEVIYLIAEAAKLSHAKYDAIIYLFCADRHDVLEKGGVCGNIPNCGLCPITALCPFNKVSKVIFPYRHKVSGPFDFLTSVKNEKTLNCNDSTCSRCSQTKSSGKFRKDEKRTSGLTAMCINCIKVHHQKSTLIAQFIKERCILLYRGMVISSVKTLKSAESYAKNNDIELDIVDNVKKLFNE